MARSCGMTTLVFDPTPCSNAAVLVGHANDLVGAGIDSLDDFVCLLLGHTHVQQGIHQMAGEAGEVLAGDASAMMRMGERPATVSDGAACGHDEELTLHCVEFVEGGVFKKWCQIGVCQHADIKGGNEVGDHFITTEALVEGGWVHINLRSKKKAGIFLEHAGIKTCAVKDSKRGGGHKNDTQKAADNGTQRARGDS